VRKIDRIVIHCSAAPNGRRDSIEDVDRWHKDRGFLRKAAARAKHRPMLSSVGYHAFIDCEGRIAMGRHVDEVGAHAQGHNARSLGVCLAGTDAFTAEQWASLKLLHQTLKDMWPNATTCGHRDLPGVTKDCPGFDVGAWLRGEEVPAL